MYLINVLFSVVFRAQETGETKNATSRLKRCVQTLAVIQHSRVYLDEVVDIIIDNAPIRTWTLH